MFIYNIVFRTLRSLREGVEMKKIPLVILGLFFGVRMLRISELLCSQLIECEVTGQAADSIHSKCYISYVGKGCRHQPYENVVIG